MSDSKKILIDAINHYNNGHYPQANALCRFLILNKQEISYCYYLLGMIATSLGLYQHASSYFRKVDSTFEHYQIANKYRKITQAESKKVIPLMVDNKRYLLIKSWGCGFFSDMDHVVSQLLLAEITHRKPIVCWGENSLYHNGVAENAFDLYFEPVSKFSLDSIRDKAFSFFPPKWNNNNIQAPEHEKWEGQFARMSALYFLNKKENVIVSDFHTYLSDLLPWTDRNGHLANLDAQGAYRYLYKKYIHPKPDVAEEVDRFWSIHIKHKNVIAVHVRGSDKINECPSLHELNSQYHPLIEKYLNSQNDAYIYLLTDSIPLLNEYKKKYGNKIIHRDCYRVESSTAIHFDNVKDKKQIGIEIIIDVYIASKCNAFIGFGGSNVSTTILHLKEWEPENHTLVGENSLFQPHLFSVQLLETVNKSV